MNKLKEIFNNISEYYKRTTDRYPVTMVLIFLTSLSAALFIDQDTAAGKFMEEYGMHFLMLWGSGTFFAETYFFGKKPLKWAGTVITGLIAAGIVYTGNSPSDTVRELSFRWMSAYGFVTVTMGVYRNFRYSGQPFNRYCIRVVHELCRLAIICSVTAIGITLVMAIFVTLILSGEQFMLIFRVQFFVLGCLAGSGILDAQIREEQDRSRFFNVIIRYLLMPLLFLAFAIIYGYILKIVITRVVPSNEIFRILAGLFIIGMPIWTLIGTFPEDHWIVRAGTKLPYIFIPFLFLQGYSIRERIAAFGMTPLRYLCLVLMLFEIVYILIYALRKRETGPMLPFAAVLAVICLVMPFVNMYSVSNRSQKRIFDRYFPAEFSELPKEDQSNLAGAYYYLDGSGEGKAMLKDADPAKIAVIRESGLVGVQEYDMNMYINFEFPTVNEDISGYDRLTLVANENYLEGIKNETYDPANMVFYTTQGEPVLTADLSKFVNACIDAGHKTVFGDPGFSGAAALEDGKLLYVTQCSMTVDRDQNITYLLINALLLEKGASE